LADLSIDCPRCGKQNSLPVDHPDETFQCSSCGETSRLDAASVSGTEKAPDYLVDEIVSDCKIIQKVGEGGFGTVYKASDQNLQRIVAFKVMLPSLTTNAEFVQKFIREAVTAAQLNHPNIVAIHKVGRDERRGLHYLIMEFVEGRTLADVVKDSGVLKVEDALPIMIQACDALATAHEHNIVHRDIKPENLMLDKLGVLKITDFGLAKSLSTDQKTTKVMGTPHYMSPEQFEGKAVDGRSDMYSLGVTFFYLFSKSRPYEGQNTVQIIYAILTQQPKALPDLNKEVPPEIWAVIQKMIAKKAEDRYQTLRETIVDLKRFQDRTQTDKTQCPACAAKNPKGRKFCRGCGAALVVKCPSCAAESPAGAATCSACGADMGRLLKIKKAMEAAAKFKSLGDLRRAAECYRQVVDVDPSHGEATAELARLSGTISEVDRVKTEADDLMKTGDIETALGRVEDLLRRFPAAAEVRDHRDGLKTALARRKAGKLLADAEAAAAAGRAREAVELLDQAIRADPANEEARTRRDEIGKRLAQASETRQKAAQALAAGRFEDAYALATEVLKVNPGDTAMADVREKAQASVASVDQFVARGKDHMAAKRLEAGLSEFEAALSLRPGDKSLYSLVESTRGKIAEQRERVAACRRLMAERDFARAAKGLAEVLAELPDDAEAKSLLASCERGRVESARAKAIEDGMREGERLEKAGEFAAALEQFDRVLALDPRNPDAAPRRGELEQKIRGERDIRELADEHLADGRYSDAVAALERLKAANPARAAAIAAEIAECKKRETRTGADLKLAEAALAKKEYRKSQEAAAAVLAVAPRHPRAAAVRKDADKAIAAIERFLAECDKLLLSEMFDEAIEALEKAKERGATPEEYKPRRGACEGGRLALLKTDATRSLVAKDYEAAIAAYDQVLEVSKTDADAMKGKRGAERRIRILTTEPLSLRISAAAAVVLLLGVVNVTAVASTHKAAANTSDVKNVEAEKAKIREETHKRQLEPELDAAKKAEDAGDFANAKSEYDAQGKIGDFATLPEITSGVAFNEAMDAASKIVAPRDRFAALGAVKDTIGDAPERRRLRVKAIAKARDAAVGAWLAEAYEMEGKDAETALKLYIEIESKAPEAKEAKASAQYLDQLTFGERRLVAARFSDAADSLFSSREVVVNDARRRGIVDDHFASLREKWITSIRVSAAAAGGDEEKWYADVVAGLTQVVRKLAPLGVTREQVLSEFQKGDGK
jgi:tetratricopeptide (TPR) repeat protein